MWQTAWGCCSYTSSGVSVRGTVAEKKIGRSSIYRKLVCTKLALLELELLKI